MKLLRQDGARLFVVRSKNPEIPEIKLWNQNCKSCLFCTNCAPELRVLQKGEEKRVELIAHCTLPSVALDGNCGLHDMNKKGDCLNFKDVDGDGEGYVMIPKKKQKDVCEIYIDDKRNPFLEIPPIRFDKKEK